MSTKLFLLRMSKLLGLFSVSSYLSRGKLPILCYHAFALNDESEFRPKLFMKGETFARRMAFLRDHGYRVLSLDEALEKLDAGTLPPKAVVITIDDGFYSVYLKAVPVLRRYSYPAILYMTTYYVEKGTPVFRLVVQYMFWRSKNKSLDLSWIVPGENAIVDLNDDGAHLELMWKIIEFGEQQCDEGARQELAYKLGKALGVDYDQLIRDRGLSLMTTAEMRQVAENGINLQLHTHRHRFPQDKQIALQELSDNARCLQQFSREPLRHFCYPSGLWSKTHWESLSEFGIRTATTCESGLNLSQTPRWALRRFLDGENISQIEFEAELCGFAQILRGLRAVFQDRRAPARSVELDKTFYNKRTANPS